MVTQVTLSIRLDLPDGSRFGPGKAQLLGEIHDNGSISAAARNLSMSYPRALRLVNEMNMQFSTDLVAKSQGGASRGGAKLTDLGQRILDIYRQIEALSTKSSKHAFDELSKYLKNE